MQLKYTLISLNIDFKYFLSSIFNKALGNHPMQIAEIQKINVNPSDIEEIQHLPEVIQSLIFNEAVFYQVSNDSHIMTAIIGLFEGEDKQFNLIVYSQPSSK